MRAYETTKMKLWHLGNNDRDWPDTTNTLPKKI
jgi:hypothetical protein